MGFSNNRRREDAIQGLKAYGKNKSPKLRVVFLPFLVGKECF